MDAAQQHSWALTIAPRDGTSVDDLASRSSFILNQAVVCSQQVLRLAERDGLVRIKSFINYLDSLDGDGQPG
jgi:hypothetical protein